MKNNFKKHLNDNPAGIIAAAIFTIGLCALAYELFHDYLYGHKTVEIKSNVIVLPYVDEYGGRLSADALPHYEFRLSETTDIRKIQYTSILVDARENKFKRVLLVRGNFPADAEFEITNQSNEKFVKRAKIINRITVKPYNETNPFIYLFENAEVKNWNVSNVVAIEEPNSSTPIDSIAIRRISSPASKWSKPRYLSSSKTIKQEYYHPNKTEEVVINRIIVPRFPGITKGQ